MECGATPQDDGLIRFWVKDNGPGLAKEAQDELFTEFTRLDIAHVEGQGLGLSIVVRILESYDSRMDVESEPGKGSIFRFDLKRV